MKWRSIFALFIFTNQSLFGAQPSQTQTAPSVERHVTFAQTVEAEPAASRARRQHRDSLKNLVLELQQMQKEAAKNEQKAAQLCLELFKEEFESLKKSINRLKGPGQLNTPLLIARAVKYKENLESLSKGVCKWQQEERRLPYYSLFNCPEHSSAMSQQAGQLNCEIKALARKLEALTSNGQ